MGVAFYPASYRASGSDLTVAISPLGLVELADEEFEVHGPRMNRYASNWAWYLGHHWMYRRELGEPQLTFNYVKALSDFITVFMFGKSVEFHSPEATSAIVPPLIKRVWEVDNDKSTVLWEMGQLGGVSGDVFIKVAYEEPYQDPSGQVHPGRVRILPLNPAFCLPVEDTEILTSSGWKSAHEVNVGDQALSLDPLTDELVWTSVEQVNIFDWDGPMARWRNERFDALSTPDHRWIAQASRGSRRMRPTSELHDLRGGGAGTIVVGGGTPMCFSEVAKYSDDLVEAVGWFVTEGHWHKSGAPMFTQSEEVNPVSSARIDRIVKAWGGSVYRYEDKATQWYSPAMREDLHEVVGDGKSLLPKFLASLTHAQAQLLYGILLDGDGHRGVTTVWSQSSEHRVDGFQMLAMMLGLRTQARWRQRQIGQPTSDVTVYSNRTLNIQNLDRTWEHYDGKVWCPTTGTGTWVARRKGTTFHTGNCFPEFHPHDRTRMIRFKLKYKFWGTALDGTRQVLTYTEILTETGIQEFINDELIRNDPNTMGDIPIVHIPNTSVASSPWGLSDIQDIISLNREFNEKATEVSDIINYHGSPVTVITGAKASNLEKGPKKVWSIGSKDAKIQNLTMDTNFAGILGYMELLKQAMHEMTGVPQAALGQMQPISNTSGTALSVQYQPLMNRYHLKQLTYSPGFDRINALILKTLALKEPESMMYNPVLAGITPKPDQYLVLNPADPLTYRTTTLWPSPLPMDVLVKINEIQAKMALGLESKRGALRDLGEQFPDQKMQEIFEELLEDTKEQGALDLLRAQTAQIQMAATGMMPDGTPLMMADGAPATGPIDQELAAEMMDRAFGVQPPQTLDYDNNSGA